MRPFPFGTLGLLMLATLASTPAAAQFRVVPDDAWCDDQVRSDRPTHCEVRELTLVRPGGPLSVDASPNGGIRVVAEARTDVRVRARVVARADSDEAARALADRVEVRVDSDRIESDGPRRQSRREGSWWVGYELSVPADLDLRLRSTNGGLSVTGVQAALDLRTTNGGIELEGIGGDVRGRTTNGGLRIRLDGERWEGAGLDLETTNGGVTLEIPSTYAARLETGTVNGSWDIDYPIVVRGRLGRRLTTELGDGGSLVRAVTTNGRVRIDRR